MPRTIHIIGAGLAGLSAAVRLAARGEAVAVHEAAAQAGGRCRSYHDPALDMVIDNGNHLLLSGNHAALAYLRTIGAANSLIGPPGADFAFVDLASGARWTLRINEGRLPWWIFKADRRVPGTRAARLSRARAAPVGRQGQDDRRHGRVRRPALRAAGEAAVRWPRSTPIRARRSARLAGAIVRETLVKGGKACRPLIARDGLGSAFIDPALTFLAQHNAAVRFGHRLRGVRLRRRASRRARLRRREASRLGTSDAVILAVPPVVAGALRAGAHDADRVPRHRQRAFPDRAAARSAADHRRDQRHHRMAVRLPRPAVGHDQRRRPAARYAARGAGGDNLAARSPPSPAFPTRCRRGRSCASAAPPSRRRRQQDAKRPGAATAWRNLVLAGDWTETGLPATIEGAIRSGNRAADLAGRQ